MAQDAFAVTTNITDEPSCENAPVLGTFDSGTCVLPGTHTIPISDLWDFFIDTKVTGTVNVNGQFQLREPFDNFGTINVIGDPGNAFARGQILFGLAPVYTNHCSGIINLIAGTNSQSGGINIQAIVGFPSPVFDNFGTITGTNSNLGNLQATIVLNGGPPISTFNNHGTFTALVAIFGNSIFNDNLPDQCVVGGNLVPIDSTALLLAGTQSFSWMIPAIVSAVGIGIVVARKF